MGSRPAGQRGSHLVGYCVVAASTAAAHCGHRSALVSKKGTSQKLNQLIVVRPHSVRVVPIAFACASDERFRAPQTV